MLYSMQCFNIQNKNKNCILDKGLFQTITTSKYLLVTGCRGFTVQVVETMTEIIVKIEN